MDKKFLIVGAGLYGAVCARELADAGHHCVVIERRNHLGGNCYTRYDAGAGCHEHVYGPHIFHTGNQVVWEYVQRFALFNHYVNRPKVRYGGRLFSFPINLMTLYQLYGVSTPEEARAKLAELRSPVKNPASMEEWCLAQVGPEIYETFIKGYTLKQWRKHPRDLPASIVQRLPIRLTFDDNYFTHPYQGIPIGGYTAIFERLLSGIEVRLGIDFLEHRDALIDQFDLVIFTGPIDAFFRYSEGILEYRSLRFERKCLDMPDYQGNAIVNYTEEDVPYTRIVEHKHFDLSFAQSKTVVTLEFPDSWEPGKVEYYPVDTERNRELLERYRRKASREVPAVTFGGRLGEYKYYDMDEVIASALNKVKSLIQTL